MCHRIVKIVSIDEPSFRFKQQPQRLLVGAVVINNQYRVHTADRLNHDVRSPTQNSAPTLWLWGGAVWGGVSLHCQFAGKQRVLGEFDGKVFELGAR